MQFTPAQPIVALLLRGSSGVEPDKKLHTFNSAYLPPLRAYSFSRPRLLLPLVTANAFILFI